MAKRPAGWYPDPKNPNQERYWYGRTWSEQTRLPGEGDDAAPAQTPPFAEWDPHWRRRRNRKMVKELRQTGDKWRMALEGERFALFSVVGTKDWEDYASAAIQAMLLETSTDAEERLDALEQQVADVGVLLGDIRDLLRVLVQANNPT